jgi:hypothetical protein
MSKLTNIILGTVFTIGIGIGSYCVGREMGFRQVDNASDTMPPAGIITSIDRIVCGNKVYPEEINAEIDIRYGIPAGQYVADIYSHLRVFVSEESNDPYEKNIQTQLIIDIFRTYSPKEQKETIQQLREKL